MNEEETKRKEKKLGMYLGFRNGESGWYEKKWEGLETEDNKDIGEYEGEIENGEPNGQGKYTHWVLQEKGYEYVGSWKDGEKCNSELYKDHPEFLSDKLTMKEYVESTSVDSKKYPQVSEYEEDSDFLNELGYSDYNTDNPDYSTYENDEGLGNSDDSYYDGYYENDDEE